MGTLLAAYAIGAVAALSVLAVFAIDRESRLGVPTRILSLVIAWPLAFAYAALFASWWVVSLGGRRKPFDVP